MLRGTTPSPQALAAKKCAPPSAITELNDIIMAMTDFEPGARPTLAEVAHLARTLVAS
jgi:hypothetical protein